MVSMSLSWVEKYTAEDVIQSRWAPVWLLASTRFLSFLALSLVLAFHHHPSYTASLFVTGGLALSYLLLALAAPLLCGDKHENITISINHNNNNTKYYYYYPTLAGCLYSCFAVLNSYLLVDFLRLWVHWGTWEFTFWWDLYMPADLLAVVLMFVFYAADTLVMQANIRLNYRCAISVLAINSVAFTAVYAADVSHRINFVKHPAAAAAFWAAHIAAYVILTVAIVALSRIRWCCGDNKTTRDDEVELAPETALDTLAKQCNSKSTTTDNTNTGSDIDSDRSIVDEHKDCSTRDVENQKNS